MQTFAVVLQVNIDRQNRLTFQLYGEGVDEVPMGVISIDKESGMLYVHKAVDYEEWQKLEVRINTR